MKRQRRSSKPTQHSPTTKRQRRSSKPSEHPPTSQTDPAATSSSTPPAAGDVTTVPAYDFDDTQAIEAGRLNHFQLTDTFADALEYAKSQGMRFDPGEEDPHVFDLEHIVNALRLNEPAGLPSESATDNSAPANPESDGSSSDDTSSEAQAPQKKKKNKKKRSKKDQERHANRKKEKIRGGFGREGGYAPEGRAQRRRQLRSNLLRSEIYRQYAFSTITDMANASTGWRGLRMPQKEFNKWRRQYTSGEIKAKVATFIPVPFNGKSTMIVDRDGRLFAYRTETIRFLDEPEADRSFHNAIVDLLDHVLSDPEAKRRRKDQDRGKHEPCIIGHQREYKEAPALTDWHFNNVDRVNTFMAHKLIEKATNFVNRQLEVMFPGVAARYKNCKDWHENNDNPRFRISPLFGLYWCLCINGMFRGQSRIFCDPHIDFKNIVGVCALLVYQLPGFKFDHATMCWLVLWEAEVAIQLPPWTVLLYPSSLLHHFNIDIRDFEFVTTNADVKKPTKQNSTPLRAGDGNGRGSFVWFNQASQFTAAETGYTLLKNARKDGKAATRDYGKDASAAFPIHGAKIPMQPQ